MGLAAAIVLVGAIVVGPDLLPGARVQASHDGMDCRADRERIEALIARLMKEGDFDRAWRAAVDCTPVAERHFGQLRDEATIAASLAYLASKPSSDPEKRLKTIEELQQMAPSRAVPFAEEVPALRAAVAMADIKNRAATRGLASLVEPQLGMSASEVRAGAWGPPRSINSMTTSRGEHEQWVYGDRRYLYFERGVLVTIQENR